jgi:Tol biopolymer transport system component/DNA-binding winged helix-turn-helix (wHTH) protein
LTSEFRIGRRLVQPELNTIVLAGRPTRVEPKVMEVLAYLVKRPGEVVQRETLIRDVWGDTFVTDAALTRCIGELRRLFDDDVRDPRVIQTIAKSGYRLIAEVEPAGSGDVGGPLPDLVDDRAANRNTLRPRLLTPTLLVAGGILIGVVATFLVMRPGKPDNPKILRTALSLYGDVLQNVPPSALVQSVAIAPDGSRIAYVGVRDGKRGLFVRALDGREATQVPESGGACVPFFSPDGRWVGFWADGKIKKASIENLSVVAICESKDFRGASWAPDGSVIFATAGRLLRVPAAGGSPQIIAGPDPKEILPLGLEGYAEPEVLPSGSHVLATQFRQPYDRRDVVAVSFRDGRRKILVRDGRWPRYAASGHLVYRGDSDRLLAVPFDAERVEVTGPPVVVAEGVLAAEFTISNTGSLLYAAGNNKRYRLTWVDRTGKAQPFGPAKDYNMPALSPDERRVAVGVEPDIFVYDLERDTLTHFASNGYFPIWTPDGKKLTYVASRADGEELNLWWRNADGTGEEERLTSSPIRQFPGSWSPDGRYLAFGSYDVKPSARRGQEILVLDLQDGRKVRCLTCSEGHGNGAVFSPDGLWLAYHQFQRGPSEVFARPFKGSGQIQISNEGGYQPAWSPTGKELFYWKTTQTGMQMLAVDVVPGPLLRPGKPHVLFEGNYRSGGRANYDVTRDGQRFLMIQPIATPPITELQLVVNWFEELHARARPTR